MADIEKVITGLELCTNISQDGCLMLCPYKDEVDETYSGFCEHVLKSDALELLLELLQERKPKLLTLEEVERSKGRDVFVETHNEQSPTCDIPVIDAVFALTIDEEQPTYDHVWFYKGLYLKKDYGKTWRCWTARPTVEQRKAKEWESC